MEEGKHQQWRKRTKKQGPKKFKRFKLKTMVGDFCFVLSAAGILITAQYLMMPEEQQIAVGVLDFKSTRTIITVLEWLKKLNIA